MSLEDFESQIPAEYRSDFDQFLLAANANTKDEVAFILEQSLREVFCDEQGNELTPRKKMNRISELMASWYPQLVQLLEGNRQEFEKRQITHRYEIRRSQRTMLKTFQELLVSDPLWQQFEREDIKRTSLHTSNMGELLQQIPVDPKKITDSILRACDLEQYIPKNMEQIVANEEQRKPRKNIPKSDQVTMRAMAIPLIKKFFAQNVGPLALSHEVWGYKKERLPLKLLHIHSGEKRGKIMVIQNDATHTSKNVSLLDLPGISRQLDHIDEGYQEEIRELEQVNLLFQQTLRKIDTCWSDEEAICSFEQILDDIHRDITNKVSKLQWVKNEYKKKILQLLKTAANKSSNALKDRRGQTNPSAFLAGFNPVKKFVGERINQTTDISGKISSYKMRVLTLRQQETNRLTLFCSDVDAYGNHLHLMDLEKILSKQTKKKIIYNLRALKKTCKKFSYHPYLLYAEKIISTIDTLIECLHSEEVENVREIIYEDFLRIYSWAKVLRLENDIINLRDKYFSPGQKPSDVHPDSVREDLEGIKQKLLVSPFQPEHVSAEAREPYDNIQEQLEQWITLTTEAGIPNKTKKERNDLLHELNARLKAFHLS